MVFLNRKPLLQNGGVPLVWYLNAGLTGALASTTVSFSYTDNRGRVCACSAMRATSLFGAITLYYTYNSREQEVYKTATNPWKGEFYRTITFEQSPTGDLLTWLQMNATPV